MFRLLRLNFGISLSLLAILMAPLGASAATSEQSDNLRTQVVKFGDLDLTRESLKFRREQQIKNGRGSNPSALSGYVRRPWSIRLS